jgi:ACS family glucarate transporter-like MFS transporter
MPPAAVTPEAAPSTRRTHVRWTIVTVLFLVTTINYADRATLSITASAISKQYGIGTVTMGYLFSAFGWSYVLAQLPGGWILNRFGARQTYLWSLVLWSLFTLAQGVLGFVSITAAAMVSALFVARLLVGVAEAPSMPANSRIVATWFPAAERGISVGLFNSAQYFATALFIPIMSALTFHLGWEYTFLFMGLVGILFVPVMVRVIKPPSRHPRVNQAERDYIRAGGALDETQHAATTSSTGLSTWECLRRIMSNRMMVGIFLGQYCIGTLTYFFLTWFPVYLVKERGMSILQVGFVAVLPALCGCLGSLIGGAFADQLLKRGVSLSVARKTPIVAGMLLSTSMMICNYVRTDAVVVAVMALAFLGKGIGAQGWTVLVDTAPKEIMGFTGGVFNFFGNIGAVTTPIVIGYIVSATGSFNGALVFVSANAVMAIVSFLIIVPRLHRMSLQTARDPIPVNT